LSDGPLLVMAQPEGGIGSPSDRSWDSFLWDLGPESEQGSGQNWGTWGKLYGLFGDRKTKNNVTGYSYNVLGESVGVEVQLSDRFIGGATGGHSSGQVDYDTLADQADLETIHAGLYSTYGGNGWYLNSLVTYAWTDVDTERVVDLTSERHEGQFKGRELSGYIEAGLDWQPAASWLVQPLTAFQTTHLHLDQYAETGGASALVYEDQQYESYKASVGAKVTKELSLDRQGRTAIVQARARWVHEFGDVLSSVQTRFDDVPPISWTVTDEEVSRDSIMLGVGAGIRLTRGLRAFVDYDTSFDADRTVHVISVALDYRW
jgi:subtilase-type serine protease